MAGDAMIEVGKETRADNQFGFEVRVTQGGQVYDYQVTLSWADHNLWSRGVISPEAVVRRAFEFLLEREPASSIMSRFDCAVIRRYFPEVDREMARGDTRAED